MEEFANVKRIFTLAQAQEHVVRQLLKNNYCNNINLIIKSFIVAQTTYSTSCVITSQCITSLGLQCTSGICQCATTSYWDTGAQTCSKLDKHTF